MSVEHFILGLNGQQKAIVIFLHQRLTNYHGLQPKIRYKVPMYFNRKWVCYLNPIKGNGIELAFLKGNQLSNEQGLLNKKDRKMVAGIDLYSVESIPERVIDEIIQEALLLEELDSK